MTLSDANDLLEKLHKELQKMEVRVKGSIGGQRGHYHMNQVRQKSKIEIQDVQSSLKKTVNGLDTHLQGKFSKKVKQTLLEQSKMLNRILD